MFCGHSCLVGLSVVSLQTPLSCDMNYFYPDSGLSHIHIDKLTHDGLTLFRLQRWSILTLFFFGYARSVWGFIVNFKHEVIVDFNSILITVFPRATRLQLLVFRQSFCRCPWKKNVACFYLVLFCFVLFCFSLGSIVPAML